LLKYLKLSILAHTLTGKDIPEKTYSRAYPAIPPEYLFSILVQLLKSSNSFKVWKADETARHINMTTYPQLLGVTNRREQIDVYVVDGEGGAINTTLPIVQIKVTPATAPEQFTMVDFFLRRKGIVESRSDSIAKMILEDLDARIVGKRNA